MKITIDEFMTMNESELNKVFDSIKDHSIQIDLMGMSVESIVQKYNYTQIDDAYKKTFEKLTQTIVKDK